MGPGSAAFHSNSIISFPGRERETEGGKGKEGRREGESYKQEKRKKDKKRNKIKKKLRANSFSSSSSGILLQAAGRFTSGSLALCRSWIYLSL